MRYFEVYVAAAGYQKNEPLTYCSEDALQPGTVVRVNYGASKNVSGFIVREVAEPEFKTKPIVEVLSHQPLPTEIMKLHQWLLSYYPSGSGVITQAFVPSQLTTKFRQTKSAETGSQPAALPALTETQTKVIHDIEHSKSKAFLLHGETGSGKTRIYLECVRATLKSGQSALVLVPEISLMPQISKLFESYYGKQVITLHSGLTKATRNKNWLRVLQAEAPLIVIGTRSALFAPIPKIGTIIVDEMHEPAYKQESAPRYYALRVAAQLARLHNAEIIYGSATPPVTEYFIAEQTGVPILRMDTTARKAAKVTSKIIDLKDSKLFGRHRQLSDELLNALEKRLVNHEQSLLFLNRRGSFRTILCQNCGWQAMCPRCDMPLTYHGDAHQMRCHTCGYHSTPPLACPSCSSDDIIYRSLGTKALVEMLQNLFPEAIIKRFDTDNLADEQLHKHFDAVLAGEVDILVGTQMLGKGLDLPKLSLVGIVNADTNTAVPDFSSAERSYQLLHQAIGRVGRGHLDGEVIIQSFQPDNPNLVAAVSQQWRKLYEQEITERRQFGFPPFYFLLKLAVSRKTSSSAEENITKLHRAIRAMPLHLKVNEPTPSFYERSHGAYNWQLIVRAKNRGELLKVIEQLPKGDYTYDLDPLNLL